MSAHTKTALLQSRLASRGVPVSFNDAQALRRAAMTLHSWAERECGTDYGCIERDEQTGKTYWLNSTTMRRFPIADRESGALRRVAAVCKANSAHFYHQTDPRGAALYVAREPLTNQNYSSVGVCCDVD